MIEIIIEILWDILESHFLYFVIPFVLPILKQNLECYVIKTHCLQIDCCMKNQLGTSSGVI